MVSEERLDDESVAQMEWVKKNVDNKSVKYNEKAPFLLRMGVKKNIKADVYVAYNIINSKEIPLNYKEVYLTSKVLKFYDVYDVLKPVTENFLIYHVKDVLVAEVKFDE